ncbi:MAG: DUF2752 domain-containing protein [Verrucomicrobiota bacterium]|nr:DUF2752 domain-containing protein [Verrucomicrobiota bacterium]
MRGGALLATALAALLLRVIDPATLTWLPLRTSCGAATGLPCIFCGTTRALHHLLAGDIAQALYFNWIAFPVAAAAIVAAVNFALELSLRRRVFRLPVFDFTPRRTGAVAVALVALWIFQVTLAVTLHKRELLNPNGVLYAFFVK